jgi:chloramphenicol-sensitive protein RarD
VNVEALAGMTTETLTVLIPAAGYLIWIQVHGQGHFGIGTPALSGLLSLSGFITVGPLLLFAAAARRIPLSTIGLIQYITPVMQFLIGVFVFGEDMPAGRLAGFALVWVALAIMALDGIRVSSAAYRVRSTTA